MNILIVDDEKSAAKEIQEMIDTKEYGIREVYAANNMSQAIEMLKNYDISIMICGVLMRMGNGLELVAWIRDQELGVMVIFQSRYALFEYAQAAIRLGAVEYLLKPVERDELNVAVETAVDKIQNKLQMRGDEECFKCWNSGRAVLPETEHEAIQNHERDCKASAAVQKVKLYIEEHVGEEISRDELAAKVYLHPDYMNRLFKEQVGTSFSNYVIQVRLNYAKYLLQTTNASISDVAVDVGYPNMAYFTKIFKRLTGMTPTEFRKKQGALRWACNETVKIMERSCL